MKVVALVPFSDNLILRQYLVANKMKPDEFVIESVEHTVNQIRLYLAESSIGKRKDALKLPDPVMPRIPFPLDAVISDDQIAIIRGVGIADINGFINGICCEAINNMKRKTKTIELS